MAAGRILQPGGPRIEDPSFILFCLWNPVGSEEKWDGSHNQHKVDPIKIKIGWDTFMLKESLVRNFEVWRNQQEFVDLKWNSVWHGLN